MTSRKSPAKIAWSANCKQISGNQCTYRTNAKDIPERWPPKVDAAPGRCSRVIELRADGAIYSPEATGVGGREWMVGKSTTEFGSQRTVSSINEVSAARG